MRRNSPKFLSKWYSKFSSCSYFGKVSTLCTGRKANNFYDTNERDEVKKVNVKISIHRHQQLAAASTTSSELQRTLKHPLRVFAVVNLNFDILKNLLQLIVYYFCVFHRLPTIPMGHMEQANPKYSNQSNKVNANIYVSNWSR